MWTAVFGTQFVYMIRKMLSAWLMFCVLICKPVLPLKMSVDNVCVHDRENIEHIGNLLCVDSQAYAALEEMRSRMPGVQLAFYVNMKTIEAIHRALDIPLSSKAAGSRLNGFSPGGGDEEEEGEFVEEEVIDDMYPPGDNV